MFLAKGLVQELVDLVKAYLRDPTHSNVEERNNLQRWQQKAEVRAFITY